MRINNGRHLLTNKVIKKPGDGVKFPKKGEKVDVHYVGAPL